MEVWLTADTHLGHAKLSGNACWPADFETKVEKQWRQREVVVPASRRTATSRLLMFTCTTDCTPGRALPASTPNAPPTHERPA